MEYQFLRIQQFRADERQQELFKGHAVVGEETAHGEGERRQDAHPADVADAHDIAQAEIHAHGHQHGQQGEDELPQGQAEEYAFLIVPDFFVDADFYKYYLLSMEWLICVGSDVIVNSTNDRLEFVSDLIHTRYYYIFCRFCTKRQ